MPLIRGVSDDVLYGALAAAAAPLAIALSPSFERKQPLARFPEVTPSTPKLLHLLLANVRLWLVKQAQKVLSATEDQKATQMFSREAILQRMQEFSPSSSSVSLRNAGATGVSFSPRDQLQQQFPFVADAETNFAAADIFSPDSFAAIEKDSLSSRFRKLFCGAGRKHRDSRDSTDSAAVQDAARDGPETVSTVSLRGEVARPPEGEFCSICHDDFTLPCQANCGHWFCAECFLRLWHHTSALSACACPICRRNVASLLISEGDAAAPAASPRFSLNSLVASPGVSLGLCSNGEEAFGEAQLTPAQRSALVQDIAKYNRLFGGAPVSLWQRVLDMPVLLKRVGRNILDPTWALSLLHSVRFAACILGAGVYVLSPLNIISESVLGVLGRFDDMMFLACAAFYLTVLYKAMLHSRTQPNPPPEASP